MACDGMHWDGPRVPGFCTSVETPYEPFMWFVRAAGTPATDAAACCQDRPGPGHLPSDGPDSPVPPLQKPALAAVQGYLRLPLGLARSV